MGRREIEAFETLLSPTVKVRFGEYNMSTAERLSYVLPEGTNNGSATRWTTAYWETVVGTAQAAKITASDVLTSLRFGSNSLEANASGVHASNGATGTFTSNDGKTITVTDGIITSIV